MSYSTNSYSNGTYSTYESDNSLNNANSQEKKKIRVRVSRKKYDENGNLIPHHPKTAELTTMQYEDKQYKQPKERLLRKRRKKNTIHLEEIEDPEHDEFDEVRGRKINYFSKFMGKTGFDTITESNTFDPIDTASSSYVPTLETVEDKTGGPRTEQTFTSFVGTTIANDPSETSSGFGSDSWAPRPYVDREALKNPFPEIDEEELQKLYPQSRKIPTHSFDSSAVEDPFSWIKHREISSINQVQINTGDEDEFNNNNDNNKQNGRNRRRGDASNMRNRGLYYNDSDTFGKLNRLTKKPLKKMNLNGAHTIDNPTGTPTFVTIPSTNIIEQIEEEEEIIEVYNSLSTTSNTITSTSGTGTGAFTSGVLVSATIGSAEFKETSDLAKGEPYLQLTQTATNTVDTNDKENDNGITVPTSPKASAYKAIRQRSLQKSRSESEYYKSNDSEEQENTNDTTQSSQENENVDSQENLQSSEQQKQSSNSESDNENTDTNVSNSLSRTAESASSGQLLSSELPNSSKKSKQSMQSPVEISSNMTSITELISATPGSAEYIEVQENDPGRLFVEVTDTDNNANSLSIPEELKPEQPKPKGHLIEELDESQIEDLQYSTNDFPSEANRYAASSQASKPSQRSVKIDQPQSNPTTPVRRRPPKSPSSATSGKDKSSQQVAPSSSSAASSKQNNASSSQQNQDKDSKSTNQRSYISELSNTMSDIYEEEEDGFEKLSDAFSFASNLTEKDL